MKLRENFFLLTLSVSLILGKHVLTVASKSTAAETF